MEASTPETERRKTAAYWGKSYTYPPNWYAFPPTSAYINESITGRSDLFPTPWACAAFLPGPPAGRALEIACGHGKKLVGIVQSGQARSGTGVDLSEGAIEEARKAAASAGLSDRVTFEVQNMNHPSLAEEAYDFAVCNGALHHFAALERSAIAIYRSLKPGGYLFASEFTGPSRYLYSPAETDLINRGKELLPAILKRGPFRSSDLHGKLEADPSEAVRSSEIKRVLLGIFDEVICRPYGGNVCMRAMDPTFFRMFDFGNREHLDAVAALIALEKEALREGVESHHYYFVARKTRTYPQDAYPPGILDVALESLDRLVAEREEAQRVARAPAASPGAAQAPSSTRSAG